MTRSGRRGPRALAVIAVALVACWFASTLPRPGSAAITIEGIVVRAERTAGTRLEAGTRGAAKVRLDDGTVVFVPTHRAALPPARARVAVTFRPGWFGQRVLVSMAPR